MISSTSFLISDLDRCAGCTCEAKRVGPHLLPLCGICQVVEEENPNATLVYVRAFRRGKHTQSPLRLLLAVPKRV
jgi:hypothetical protein